MHEANGGGEGANVDVEDVGVLVKCSQLCRQLLLVGFAFDELESLSGEVCFELSHVGELARLCRYLLLEVVPLGLLSLELLGGLSGHLGLAEEHRRYLLLEVVPLGLLGLEQLGGLGGHLGLAEEHRLRLSLCGKFVLEEKSLLLGLCGECVLEEQALCLGLSKLVVQFRYLGLLLKLLLLLLPLGHRYRMGMLTHDRTVGLLLNGVREKAEGGVKGEWA